MNRGSDSLRVHSGWQLRVDDDSTQSPATQLADLLCKAYGEIDALKQRLIDFVAFVKDLDASVKKLIDLYYRDDSEPKDSKSRPRYKKAA
jgi:hypothetical protein